MRRCFDAGELGGSASWPAYPLGWTDVSVTPYGGFGLTRDLKANPDTACPVILILDRFQDEWLGRWSGADALVNRPVDPFALALVASQLLEEEQGEATLEGATS